MKNFIKITVISSLLMCNYLLAQRTRIIKVHGGYQSFYPDYLNENYFVYSRGKEQTRISIDCLKLNLNDTIKWISDYPFLYIGTDAGNNLHTITADTIPDGANTFHFDWDNALASPWNMDIPIDQYKTYAKTYIPNVPGFYLYKCIPHGSHMRGCFSVTGVVSSVFKSQKVEIEPVLYPNPAKNYIEIILNTDDKYVIDIINAKGDVVKTERTSGMNLYKLNIEDLSNGTYIVHLKYCACQKPKQSCTGASQKYRFIKE